MGVLRVRDGGQWVDIDTSGSWVPIGTILMFGGPNAPGGFLLCNGNAVSRSTYVSLFNVIGTTWGAGDGTTTFNVPDMRGRVGAGAGQGTGLTNRVIGTVFGEESHLLLAAESGMPAHTPSMASMGSESVDHSHTYSGNTGYVSNDHTHTTAATDVVRNVGGGFLVQNVAAGGYNYNPLQLGTNGISANHYHGFSGTTSGRNQGHTHAVSMNAVSATNASAAHNVMQPTVVVNHIIRVS